jgi:DNA-directed RNA polymerase specialized sigma24 family protein
VLLLVICEGLKPIEAAEVCGVTPDALRQRLARARAALIRHMNLDRPAMRCGT